MSSIESKQNEHFRYLETLYLKGAINDIYKPKIEVLQGACVIRQEVSSRHFHAGGALHGSVLFKLLDDSAFFAANSIEFENFVLTGTFSIKFLKPVNNGLLIAKGLFLNRTGRKISARSTVVDEQGAIVASGEGIFIVSNISLTTL